MTSLFFIRRSMLHQSRTTSKVMSDILSPLLKGMTFMCSCYHPTPLIYSDLWISPWTSLGKIPQEISVKDLEGFDIKIYELQHIHLSLSYSKCWGKVVGEDGNGNLIIGLVTGALDGYENKPEYLRLPLAWQWTLSPLLTHFETNTGPCHGRRVPSTARVQKLLWAF